MVEGPAKVKNTVVRTKSGRKTRSIVQIPSAARTHRARIPENYGPRRDTSNYPQESPQIGSRGLRQVLGKYSEQREEKMAASQADNAGPIFR